MYYSDYMSEHLEISVGDDLMPNVPLKNNKFRTVEEFMRKVQENMRERLRN